MSMVETWDEQKVEKTMFRWYFIEGDEYPCFHDGLAIMEQEFYAPGVNGHGDRRWIVMNSEWEVLFELPLGYRDMTNNVVEPGFEREAFDAFVLRVFTKAHKKGREEGDKAGAQRARAQVSDTFSVLMTPIINAIREGR